MLSLILSGLRQRAAALSAIAIAAGLGSALIVLCGAMFESGIRLTAPPERVSGADPVVIGDPSYTMLDRDGEETTDLRPYPERNRLDHSVVDEALSVDGVEQAIPIQLFDTYAQSLTDARTLTGQNWSAASISGLTIPEGIAPESGEVILTDAAAETLDVVDGSNITLTIAGNTTQAQVAGVLGGPDDAYDSATVFFHDSDLHDHAEFDESIDALGIVSASDVEKAAVRDALDAELADVRVLTGDGRGAAEDPAVSASRIPTIVIGAVFGGIVLTVLATVTSGIVTLAVRQRSREISLLRATGASGRQARSLLVGETSIAGVLGAAVGLALGIPLAHVLFSVMRSGGVVPEGLELRIGLLPFAIAAVTTSLVVWLAARVAARPARHARAIDMLREAELPRAHMGAARWVLGVVFGLGAIALAIITLAAMPPALVSATAGPAVLAGAISGALLSPALLRLGLTLSCPLLGSFYRGPSGLAGVNVRARLASFSTVTGAAALVVGIGAGNLISQTMLTTAENQAHTETIDADAVIDGPAGAANEHADDIAELPEVAAVSSFVVSGGWIEQPYDASHRDRPWPVRGINGANAAQMFSNQLVDGDFDDLTGQSIAIPDSTATDLGVGIGDAVDFRFGDGTGSELLVVATFHDLPGYENLILPDDLLAAHTTARAPTSLLVTASDGSSEDDFMSTLDEALAEEHAIAVGDRDALDTAVQEGANINALINTLMLLAVLAYAMIAVVNTVAVSVLGRRRELAMLRLAGATRRQVRTLLLTETTLATATGFGAGVVVACVAIVPTAIIVGANPLGSAPLTIFLSLGIAVALITLPITAIAARRAMKGRPADTIGEAA